MIRGGQGRSPQDLERDALIVFGAFSLGVLLIWVAAIAQLLGF